MEISTKVSNFSPLYSISTLPNKGLRRRMGTHSKSDFLYHLIFHLQNHNNQQTIKEEVQIGVAQNRETKLSKEKHGSLHGSHVKIWLRGTQMFVYDPGEVNANFGGNGQVGLVIMLQLVRCSGNLFSAEPQVVRLEVEDKVKLIPLRPLLKVSWAT